MSATPEPRSADRSRVRYLVTILTKNLDDVREKTPVDRRGAVDDLTASVEALLEELDVEPEPPTRQCSACGRYGALHATRCLYCWARLSALPPAEEQPAPVDPRPRSPDHAPRAQACEIEQ